MIAYPTMEELFGSLDYCTCEHCRSVLSPAAYLVDLLQFINLKKYNSQCHEIPTSYEKENPIDVLLNRRPDIEHIELSCENTNTALPYIDLVNEILEFYVANNTLTGFEGYNIEDITSEELLANPQFVTDRAYTILKDQIYPFDLPFNQRLESLRLFYNYSGVKLYEAMEKLRVNDEFEAAGVWWDVQNTTNKKNIVPNVNVQTPFNQLSDVEKSTIRNYFGTIAAADKRPYAWQEIYNEFLDISPEEYTVLTDSKTKKIPAYFGEDENISFDNKVFNAKTFSRRTGITYDELIELVKTQFINPNSYLITKLQKLGISFTDIKEFEEGKITADKFNKKIPSDLVISMYGGDVKKWVKDNYDKIMHLILLVVPRVENADCGFDKSELRYSLPYDANNTLNNTLKEMDYWRLLRFIRLWKKLGWTIEQTDKAITALYKTGFKPTDTDDDNTKKQKLDDGFKDLLVKIAHVKKIKEKLNLQKKNSLVDLLTLWSDIDTTGNNSLYAKLFLNSTILKIDPVFAENGYGQYLQDPNEKITGHLTALQAAFNVTAQELSLILKDANFDNTSILSLENVSKVYRYSFLARALKLSIWEFLKLKTMSGIDPFHELEDVHPSTLEFIELAQLVKKSDFKIATLDYLFQHEDMTGKASPSRDSILSLAKMLRDGLVRIEQEQTVGNDPTGDLAKSKMALVYESAVVDKFFGLIKGTSYSVDYSHSQADLELELKNISDKISYDDFQKRLTYKGIMSDELKNKFSTATSATDPFKAAIKKLYDLAQIDFKDYFGKYPDLKKLYNNYVSSTKPENKKMSDILDDFLPSLKNKLKHLLIKQTLGSSQNIDLAILGELLENQDVLQSVDDNSKPAIEDCLKLESGGISAQYFFADDTTANTPDHEEIITGINFNNVDQKLPVNTNNAGAKISAIWKFYLEVPVSGNYNYYIETDATAVKFSIDEISIKVDQGNDIWKNHDSVELKAGILYKVELEIDKVKDKAILKWESKGIARESMPVKYLYPYKQVENFSHTYVRFSKAISMFEKLGLHKNEIIFFSKTTSFQINGKSFLDTVPVTAKPANNDVVSLFSILLDLLYYVDLKTSLNIKDETLVDIFNDPNVKDENNESKLIQVTGWDEPSLGNILNHFQMTRTDLSDLIKFRRVYDALQIIQKFGVSSTSLLTWTTNQPAVTTVRDMKNTLRAKYDESVWLGTLQSINDQLRSQQRDALVSYVLYEMQKKLFTWDDVTTTSTNNIPTRLKDFLKQSLDATWVDTASIQKSTDGKIITISGGTNSIKIELDKAPASATKAVLTMDNTIRGLVLSSENNELNIYKATKNIDTPDKLFEYFLIDVENDPCTKTSRVKQAISSVQLFIQRCLMNLEQDLGQEVSPGSIKADQWEWMKRYRVWEANRKIFLYPENWLEPELRDNKSPFFKDLEGELLQADITDDLAENALLNYLEKLDNVSKLEICGMYPQKSDLLHVFGRTTGASRKYYYRRFEYGYWTPWEKVDLDIEDTPILPVVWNNRLFLFWLNIVRKGSSSKPLDESTTPSQLSTKQLNEAAKESIEINLSWSEYYNNKWQPRKTSDFNDPIKLDDNTPGVFKRETLSISSHIDKSGLLIYVTSEHFKLFNKHSAPLREKTIVDWSMTNTSYQTRSFNDDGNKLNIVYYKGGFDSSLLDFKHEVLTKKNLGPYDFVTNDTQFASPYEAPFFCQNRRHVFFVKPEQSLTPVTEHEYVGVDMPPGVIEEPQILPVWVKPIVEEVVLGPHGPSVEENIRVNKIGNGPLDSGTIDFLDKSVTTDKVLLDNKSITFGDAKIGPMGSQHAQLVYNNRIGKSSFEKANGGGFK